MRFSLSILFTLGVIGCATTASNSPKPATTTMASGPGVQTIGPAPQMCDETGCMIPRVKAQPSNEQVAPSSRLLWVGYMVIERDLQNGQLVNQPKVEFLLTDLDTSPDADGVPFTRETSVVAETPPTSGNGYYAFTPPNRAFFDEVRVHMDGNVTVRRHIEDCTIFLQTDTYSGNGYAMVGPSGQIRGDLYRARIGNDLIYAIEGDCEGLVERRAN